MYLSPQEAPPLSPFIRRPRVNVWPLRGVTGYSYVRPTEARFPRHLSALGDVASPLATQWAFNVWGKPWDALQADQQQQAIQTVASASAPIIAGLTADMQNHPAPASSGIVKAALPPMADLSPQQLIVQWAWEVWGKSWDTLAFDQQQEAVSVVAGLSQNQVNTLRAAAITHPAPPGSGIPTVPLAVSNPGTVSSGSTGAGDQAAIDSLAGPGTIGPSGTFTGTITLRNTGTSTWTPAYTLVSAAPGWSAPIALPGAVAPGGSITVPL